MFVLHLEDDGLPVYFAPDDDMGPHKLHKFQDTVIQYFLTNLNKA